MKARLRCACHFRPGPKLSLSRSLSLSHPHNLCVSLTTKREEESRAKGMQSQCSVGPSLIFHSKLHRFITNANCLLLSNELALIRKRILQVFCAWVFPSPPPLFWLRACQVLRRDFVVSALPVSHRPSI